MSGFAGVVLRVGVASTGTLPDRVAYPGGVRCAKDTMLGQGRGRRGLGGRDCEGGDIVILPPVRLACAEAVAAIIALPGIAWIADDATHGLGCTRRFGLSSDGREWGGGEFRLVLAAAAGTFSAIVAFPRVARITDDSPLEQHVYYRCILVWRAGVSIKR